LDKDAFTKFKFSKEQIHSYFDSCSKKLQIAEQFQQSEIRFKFAYDTLIKLGITLLATEGFKVKSMPGHHIKIIEALTTLLKDEDIDILGNRMRKQRNLDLYDEGLAPTEKENAIYLKLVKSIHKKVQQRLP